VTRPARALLLAVDDTGQVQTAQIQTADGAVHDAVEVAQPFGFASNAPGDGAISHVLVLDGDPANLVVLAPGCPAIRFGGLGKGEAVLYGSDGSRVAIRAGGTVEVWAATAVIVNSGTVTVSAPQGVSIVAAGGVAIDGNVTVTGSIVASGDISDLGGAHGTVGAFRTAYDGHTHTDPQGGVTGTPSATV